MECPDCGFDMFYNGECQDCGNILEFPVKCGKCKREIPEDSIYYDHPKYGYVCEYCPEFSEGGIAHQKENE